MSQLGELRLRVPARGLWLAFVSVGVGIASHWLPTAIDLYVAYAAVVIGWIGGAIWAYDYYREVKRFKLARDKFNLMLDRKGRIPPAG